jgi:tetratricopeptide (TPR) repeat protein
MFLLMLSMSAEATAAPPSSPAGLAQCKDVSLAARIRIAACTAAIGSGKESNASLAQIYAVRGNLRFGERHFARAIRDYDRALALKPNWGVLTLRGMAHAKTGAYELAISDCTRALQMSPGLSMAQHCVEEAQASKAKLSSPSR